MEILRGFWVGVSPMVRPLLVLATVVILLILTQRILRGRETRRAQPRFATQVLMLVASLAGLVAVILTLPIASATRGQLLNFLGLLLTGAIAFSSTTIIGNAMAGVMLRAVRNFSAGDLLRVGDHFGRVSERGLFHTEIQTETRDFTTLPNLYLVSTPVTVIRSTGTLIATEVSLGYDANRAKVEKRLLAAAKAIGLEDAFVHITSLGDFSVTYRVAGKLAERKKKDRGTSAPLILTNQSRLRGATMDALHEAGIEIVSPTFMNTRAFTTDHAFVSEPKRFAHREPEGPSAEAVMFDKAEEVSQLETERKQVTEEIEAVRDKLKELKDDSETSAAVAEELERLEERANEVDKRLADPDAEE